ncbi:GNAT family N-acetyltransferase [Nonomuraea sediminis]|uniref:GNAT family N-acetyltransferase n=1 Tax=Nonomuraea sediminis TaxID=2835864 RepID=UPI001BDC7C80|nr:GNAT family N-acetyltransferase [Nonomuraea sediminis]
MTELDIRPATSWPDVEAVFGPQGAHGGCWCLWFRATGAHFRELKGEGARDRLRALVDAPGPAPGVLAFLDGAPVGWCAVAPREDHLRLAKSPAMKPLDAAEPGVWAVTCFYVTRSGRGKGIPVALLSGAVDYAASCGARAVEGYPIDTDRKLMAAELYHGWRALFDAAGFREVARRTPTRPVMRRDLRA